MGKLLGAFEASQISFRSHENRETMRNSLAVAAVMAVLATGAMAQTQNPPAQDSPQNSAVNTQDSQTGRLMHQ